jgi:hypothetical protein
MGSLSVGTIVCHDDREDWGMGIILRVGRYTTTYFRDAGEKKFNASTIAHLVPLTDGEVSSDDLLHTVSGRRLMTSRRKLTSNLDNLLDTFQEFFPAGFADPDYLKVEDYKNNELEQAREILNREHVANAVRDEDWEGLKTRLNSSIQKTNLIFSFEKIKLRDLSDAQLPVIGHALTLICDATSDAELSEAISALADALRPDGANKWTVVSWLANLLSDREPPFVKPTPIQAAEKALAFDIKYKPHPNASTWSRINEVYKLVQTGLKERGLEPRDRFDVYTFLWYGSGLAKRNADRSAT